MHARGTVKASAGSINVLVVLAGQLVKPGDVVVADDDGVVVVPALAAAAIGAAARERVDAEETKRATFVSGVLALDLYELRPLLAQLGVMYADGVVAAPEL